MKLIAQFKGIPVYESPDVPMDTVYFIDTNNFKIEHPKRKDGQPDMRFGINKLAKALKI